MYFRMRFILVSTSIELHLFHVLRYTKINLILKYIEEIVEINAEVVETRLIQPSIIITLTETFVQHVEQILREKVIIPMCKTKAYLERMQLHIVDSILEDFKIRKAFIDAKLQPLEPSL